MEWVSVKDRLPERNCEVLVLERVGKHKNIYVARLSSQFDEWIISCNCVSGDYANNVTHWMPLPSLPKIED